MTSESGNGEGLTPSGGPKGAITDRLTKPLAKRFYMTAQAAPSDTGGFAVTLDGRPLKTPAKRALVLPTRAAAEAVAAEWAAQETVVDPAKMPMTRFTNSAIDAVASNLASVAADIVAYAGRDLVCYRADTPEKLVLAQRAAWDPILAWADQALDAHFATIAGVMPIEQSPQALQRIAAELEPHEAFRLTALHVMTTLTGSALLALANAKGVINAEDAWQTAHVDEAFQISQWGEDTEAARRHAMRREEFRAASAFHALTAKEPAS